MPVAPLAHKVVANLVGILEQRRPGLLSSFPAIASESQSKHELPVASGEIDFSGERDVAVLRAIVVPCQTEMLREILPTVRVSDEADRSGQPGMRTSESQRDVVPASEQHGVALVVTGPASIAKAPIRDVRCEQRVTTIVRELALPRFELDSLQNHVAVRIAENLFVDSVTPIEARVGELIDGNTGFDGSVFKTAVPFFFGEVAMAVGENQAKIARARLVDAREIHFVQNSVTVRVPDARMWIERCADAGLGARSPTRRNSWPSRRKAIIRVGQDSASSAQEFARRLYGRCDETPAFHEKFTNL